jgi:hypothetical protein
MDTLAPQDYKQIERKLKELEPGIWAQYLGRSFVCPHTHPSPKRMLLEMAQIHAAAVRAGVSTVVGMGSMPAISLMVSGLLRGRPMPVFGVSSQIIDAVLLSDFEQVIRWAEAPLPFEAAVLVPPRGKLSHPVYGDAMGIVYGRVPAEATHCGTLFVAASMFEGKEPQERCIWVFESLPEQRSPELDLRHPEFIDEEGKPVSLYERPYGLEMPVDLTDAHFNGRVLKFIFGLSYILAARPELMPEEPSSNCARRAPQVQHRPSVDRLPMIGLAYQIRARKPAQGSHASPRPHWRRGHIRHQPCGSGRVQRKIVWIEPVFVCPQGEEPV